MASNYMGDTEDLQSVVTVKSTPVSFDLSDTTVKGLLYKRMIFMAAPEEGVDAEAWQIEELPEATKCATCGEHPAVYRIVLIDQKTGGPWPGGSAWYDECLSCLVLSLIESDIIAPMKHSVHERP